MTPISRRPAVLLESGAALLLIALLAPPAEAQPSLGATRYQVRHEGAPASYVEFPLSPSLSYSPANRQLTIEAWLFVELPGAPGAAYPLFHSQSLFTFNDAGGFSFSLASSGHLVFGFRKGTAGTTFTTLAPVRTGRWTHVAAVFDHAASFGNPAAGAQVRFYLDGELDSTHTGAAGLGMGRNDFPIWVGGAPGVPRYPRAACLDDLRLWDRALTGEELRSGLYREVRSGTGLRAVLADGGPREVLHGSTGETHGETSLDCPGFLRPRVRVPEARAPGLDGFVKREEYPVPPALFLHDPDPMVPRTGSLYFLHSPDALHIGIDFTRLPAVQPAFPVLRFLFHTAGLPGKVPAAADLAVAVRLDGQGAWVERGDGQGGFLHCGQTNSCPDGLWDAAAGLGANGKDGGPSVEVRIAKALLGTDAKNLRIAIGHFGFLGLNDNPQNPAVRMAPGSAIWNDPSTWLPLELEPAAPEGKGTCADPIRLSAFAALPAVIPVDFAGAGNQLAESPCLPLPHPGPERYLRFTAPVGGAYRFAAYPEERDDNLALWVGAACPPSAVDCLAGSDSHGAGKPEVVEVPLELGKDYLIAIDGSFGPGGAALGKATLRIELLSAAGGTPEPQSVVDVRATNSNQVPLIAEALREVWEVDEKEGRVLGVAAGDAVSDLGAQGIAVEAYPARLPAAVQGGPQPEPPTIHFDRFRYGFPGESPALLTLETDPAGLPATETVLVASEDPLDFETVKLGHAGGRLFTGRPLAITTAGSAAFDGVLTAKPGSLLVAIWQDPRRPGSPEATVIGLAMVRGRKPLGLLALAIDPKVVPPAAATPGRAPGEPPRPLGSLAGPAGPQLDLGADQLVVRKDDPALGDFLKRHGARLVDDGLAPGVGKNPFAVARFDPAAVDVADAAALLEILGLRGTLRLSDPALLSLLALYAEERLRGHAVEFNPVITYSGQPRTREADGANVFAEAHATDCLQGLQRAWLYTSIYDREVADGMDPVRVAVIDSNFCPGIADEAVVAGGYDLYNGLPGPFGRAEVFGTGGSFHGTAMASVVGGLLDNRAGAAGSGGLVSELLLYNIGGLTYLFDAARGIRRAVADGAQVVNMSFGFPCGIAGFDFCNPVAGGLLCAFLGPIIDGILVAASPFLPLPPGSGGVACLVLVGFLAGSRGSFEDAIDVAEEAGVVLVASAGNAIDPFGEGTVEGFRIIPAVLDRVIAVGVVQASADDDGDGDADRTYFNTQFHGSAVDVWVLEAPPHFLPDADGDCPPFTVSYPGGTSGGAAYTSGVVAMVRAVNPTLNPQQIRDLLAASTVDRPGTDDRVRRFLRSDLAVMAAGNQPVGPFPDPALVTAALGFDETDGTLPSSYGPTGGCLDAAGAPWPPVLRSANDTGGAATEIAFPEESSWRGEDFGLHHFAAGPAGGDVDFFRIAAAEGAGPCSIADVTITTEYLRLAGEVRPRMDGVTGSFATADTGDRSRTTWRGTQLFVGVARSFRIEGSDNVYHLEVAAGAVESRLPDRFETNNAPATATSLPGVYRTTRDHDFIEHALRVTGLNLHCRSDRDFFRVDLPEGIEDCHAPEDSCGLGPVLGGLTQLIVSAPGAHEVRLYDPAGATVAQSGSVIRLYCPRALGYSQLLLEVEGDGLRYREYELSVRYRLPSEVASTEEVSEELNEWLCCELAEGRPCGPGSEPDDDWGGPGSIGIDIFSPWLDAPRLLEFDAFCPQEICTPAPAHYHRMSWPGGQALDLVLETPAAARDRFQGELLDSRHQVAGIARPAFIPGQGGGGGVRDAAGGGAGLGGDPLLPWDLELPGLASGTYYLRIRGLEAGEVYTLANEKPLPPLAPPAAPADLEAKGASATTIDLSWQDNTGGEALHAVERLDPGAGAYREVARLAAGATSHTDGGLAPVTAYGYRVRALGAGGPSGYSNEATADTLPGSGLVAFHRGDTNGDGTLNITDPVATLGHLFLGAAAPRCLDAADANDDGKLNITDPVAALGYLFLGGPPPAAPGPPGRPCGEDPSPDDGLSCAAYEGC